MKPEIQFSVGDPVRKRRTESTMQTEEDFS
jgi:hypothetical protein